MKQSTRCSSLPSGSQLCTFSTHTLQHTSCHWYKQLCSECSGEQLQVINLQALSGVKMQFCNQASASMHCRCVPAPKLIVQSNVKQKLTAGVGRFGEGLSGCFAQEQGVEV